MQLSAVCVCVLNLKCKFCGTLNHFGSADECGGRGMGVRVFKKIDMML